MRGLDHRIGPNFRRSAHAGRYSGGARPVRPAGADGAAGQAPWRQSGLGAVCLGGHLAVSAFADYTLQAALQQVHCPVLAIHGEQDEYGSLAHPRNVAAWAAGAVEQEIVAGGGHVPHREQPERIVARVAQFLQPLP